MRGGVEDLRLGGVSGHGKELASAGVDGWCRGCSTELRNSDLLSRRVDSGIQDPPLVSQRCSNSLVYGGKASKNRGAALP
jgi:hypothetical protein